MEQKDSDQRAPIWVVQLLALVLIGFLMYLEAYHHEFKVPNVVWWILAGVIVPVEIVQQYFRKNGNGSK